MDEESPTFDCPKAGKVVDVIELVDKMGMVYLPAGSTHRVNTVFIKMYKQNWCSACSAEGDLPSVAYFNIFLHQLPPALITLLSESAKDEQQVAEILPPDPGGGSMLRIDTAGSTMLLKMVAGGNQSNKLAILKSEENEICFLFEKDSRYPVKLCEGCPSCGKDLAFTIAMLQHILTPRPCRTNLPAVKYQHSRMLEIRQ
jgi:hypothetical protein